MNQRQQEFAQMGFQVLNGHLCEVDTETPVGDSRLANPFEDFDATYPMKPCISYEITPALIAADNAARAAREAAITWRPPAPRAEPVYRPRPDPQTTGTHRGFQRVVRPERFCASGCGASLSLQTKGDLCQRCRLAKLSADAAANRPAPALCIDGCGATVNKACKSGRCKSCHRLRLKTPEGRTEINAWRKRKASQPASQPANAKSLGTEESSPTRDEELELDELWNSLSLEDKYTVLQEVLDHA